MNADAKLDALVRREAGVALDHAVLHFDCAADRIDHAAELDDASVAGALDDPAVVDGDCGIDQIAAQRPQPRKNPILVRAREPAVADNIGDQNRRKFPGLAHGASAGVRLAQKPVPNRPVPTWRDRLLDADVVRFRRGCGRVLDNPTAVCLTPAYVQRVLRAALMVESTETMLPGITMLTKARKPD